MPAFKSYDKNKAQSSIPKPPETADDAKAFYGGDHWRGGMGWVGPTPKPGNPELAFILAEIQKQFVSRNVLKIVVDRHVSALLASEPSWMFVPVRILKDDEDPTEKEQEQIRKAEEILSEWWDKVRAVEKIKEATTEALLAKRGCVRVFVPSAKVGIFKNSDGKDIPAIPPQKLEEGILKLLYVEKLSASVFKDNDTQEEASVVVKKSDQIETTEFCYVGDDGKTIVKTWQGQETSTEIPLELGGRLIVKEIEREPLVTNQMLSAQKSLNMSLTMLDRNAIQGGFLERVILNAEPPGKWVEDSSAPGGKRFEPSPLQIGAGRTTFLASKVVESAETGDPPIVMPADVRWKDPIRPDTFIATTAEHRYGLYEEAGQLHALISSDATASAVSRIQARADFIDSLSKTKPQVDEMVRWLLEIALDHACIFASKDRATEFGLIKAACDIQVSAGPLTPEERQAVMDMVEKEMMSLETAMQMLGIEDVDAERSRLQQEAANPNPSRKLKMVDSYSKAGYAFAPDQMGNLDKEVGVEPRDMNVVLEQQAAQSDITNERVRQARNASDPNNLDANAHPQGGLPQNPPPNK